MGRRGPPPKPTALKLIQGNPGKRRLNRREPKPPPGLPECPEDLSPGARAHWARVVPRLVAMRVLSLADEDALVVYCETYARWRAARDFIAKNGEVYPEKNDRGEVVRLRPFPQVRLAQQLLQAVRLYQQEFGLTPSARSRVHGEVWDPEEEARFSRFFSRPVRGPGVRDGR